MVVGSELRGQKSDVAESVKPSTVMLIDDNEALLTVLRDALISRGFNVMAFTAAEPSLVALAENTPDIIVCDIMMPEMDGREFHRRIQEHPEWAELPFVFLTALGSPEEIRAAKALGCDDYLTKPVDPVDLAAVLQGKLHRAKSRGSKVEIQFNNYRRRVVHTLSHEFRTPLVAINTGAELLLEQFDALDSQRILHLLGSIKRGGQRLQRLIDDFMLLQQIDSGVAEAAFRRSHALQPLDDIVESAKRLFEESLETVLPNIAVLQSEGESPAADIYDVQIIDVLRRLLSNAYKFGGTEQPIEIAIVRSDPSAVSSKSASCSICIRDRGAGMSTTAIEQICRRFTQIDRDRMEQQGCGLGLSIAHFFTELNGGTLHFRRLESGFEVEVRFPAAVV